MRRLIKTVFEFFIKLGETFFLIFCRGQFSHPLFGTLRLNLRINKLERVSVTLLKPALPEIPYFSTKYFILSKICADGLSPCTRR